MAVRLGGRVVLALRRQVAIPAPGVTPGREYGRMISSAFEPLPPAAGALFAAGAAPAERSSPSSAIKPMTWFTGTSAEPSGTTILASTPSSTASTSMVALSVSISARTSPDLIASPSFFSHLESVPFSIVGESAGMRMSMAMFGPR